MRLKGWIGACFAAVVAAGSLTAAAEPEEKTKLDGGKLIGTGNYVSGEKNGAKVGEASFGDNTVEITKETLTLKGPQLFVMKYTLDTQAEPVSIKMEITESPFGAGAKAEGIIELAGDDLKLCYAPMGGAAPRKFEAGEGSGHHLFVLRRKK